MPEVTMKKQHTVKCSCPECNGTGQVTCPECNGMGSGSVPVSSMKIRKDHPNYDELMHLKHDAERIEEQHNALCNQKPERRASYDRQRDSVLAEVSRQVNELYEPED